MQLAAAAASSLQVVLPGLASVTVNAAETLAVAGEPEPVTVEPLAGELIATVGLVLSAVNVTEAEPEPPAFVAVTTIVWLPSARPVRVIGLAQAEAAAASILQVTLVGEFVAVKASEVVVWLTTEFAAGAEIVTVGGTTAATTENVVLAEPVLPAASVAATVIV